MNFLNFSMKFRQNIANHVAHPQYNCWQPGWNNLSKHAGSVFCLFILCFATNFIQLDHFHNKYKILIWVKEYFQSALGREHYIWSSTYKQTETNVSNGLLALSCNLLKLGHEVVIECGKPGCKPFVEFLRASSESSTQENFYTRKLCEITVDERRTYK